MDVETEIQKLDAIIDLHLKLKLPERVFFYCNKQELDYFYSWIKLLGSSGKITFTYPGTDQKCDFITYGGFDFYYLPLPE